MKVFSIVFLSVQLLIPHISLAQGGWDIGYKTIDSIGLDDIGKDVKIDFIKKSDISKITSEFLMNFITIGDTSTVNLDGEIIELVEKRNIHLDWGFYDEQFLECSNYTKNQTLRVYHTIIEDIKDDSVLFRLYIEIYNKYKNGKIGANPRRRCQIVWIEKSKLSGILLKK